MPNIHKPKNAYRPERHYVHKQSSSQDLFGTSIVSLKSEAESETNCCNSIRNSKLKTDSIRYNRVLSHFSGPKGRRFKSCHLDQKPACKGWFFCAFCTKTVDFYGLRRFPGETDCEGFCRIISDSDPVSSRPQADVEMGSYERLTAVRTGAFQTGTALSGKGSASSFMSLFDSQPMNRT